jgi:hypothetical protein
MYRLCDEGFGSCIIIHGCGDRIRCIALGLFGLHSKVERSSTFKSSHDDFLPYWPIKCHQGPETNKSNRENWKKLTFN